jgi:signal transduction histidine kinase
VSSDVRLLVLGLSMLLTMLLLMTGLLLYRGLSPLGQMRENLGAMLSGETRRLDQTGFRELDALVVLINRLVGESQRLVAANRETASKLAHALKTPLALISARTDAAGSAPDPDIHASVVLMRRHIEHHLKKVQVAGAPRGLASSIPVEPIVKDLLFAFAHTFRERHLSQTVDVAPGASFFGERDDLIELLGNLLDNAHRFARSRVTVSARCIDSNLFLTIADDGPGLPAPRTPLDEAASASADSSTREPPKGLGLVIADEIVKTYGGRLTFSPSGNGAGLIVEVTLPCR